MFECFEDSRSFATEGGATSEKTTAGTRAGNHAVWPPWKKQNAEEEREGGDKSPAVCVPSLTASTRCESKKRTSSCLLSSRNQ